MSAIHVDDFGTQIDITVQNCNGVAHDISQATTKQIILKAPSGSKLTKNAGFINSGTDGKIRYTTVSGDINEAGTWKVQAFILSPSGQWKTEFESFKVERNL